VLMGIIGSSIETHELSLQVMVRIRVIAGRE
jgi:hypothetical protein